MEQRPFCPPTTELGEQEFTGVNRGSSERLQTIQLPPSRAPATVTLVAAAAALVTKSTNPSVVLAGRHGNTGRNSYRARVRLQAR